MVEKEENDTKIKKESQREAVIRKMGRREWLRGERKGGRGVGTKTKQQKGNLNRSEKRKGKRSKGEKKKELRIIIIITITYINLSHDISEQRKKLELEQMNQCGEAKHEGMKHHFSLPLKQK